MTLVATSWAAFLHLGYLWVMLARWDLATIGFKCSKNYWSFLYCAAKSAGLSLVSWTVFPSQGHIVTSHLAPWVLRLLLEVRWC